MVSYWGPSNGSGQLRLDVSWTQNIAGNYSDVTAYLYYVGQWASSAGSQVGLAMSGNQVAFYTADLSLPTGTTLLTYGTLRHNHNADGTKVASVQGALTMPHIGWSLGVDSGLFSLPTIPRATTPNWSGNFVAGQAKTINLPRASSNFLHDVQYYFGTTKSWFATNAGVTTTFTPPLALLNQIPNTTTGTGSFTTNTKSGGTVIGTKVNNFTLTAGPEIVPTVSQVLWDDDNTTVKNNIGAFVQGVSLIKGSVTAAGIYSSTIRSKNLVVAGTSVSEGVPIQPQVSGTVVASGRATDSRGRVGSKSANFNVLPYEPPNVGSGGWGVFRADAAGDPSDQGTYLHMQLDALAYSLKPDGVTEKNQLTIKVFTKPTNSTIWTPRDTITSAGVITYDDSININGGAGYPVSSSFDVKIELSDKTGIAPTTLQTRIATATVTLDMNGIRVGIGKFWEQGGLDVNGDIYSDGSLVEPVGSGKVWFSETPPQGWLLCQGQEVSRTSYPRLWDILGDTWGAGNGTTTFNLPDLRGVVPVGKSTDVEFNALAKNFGTKTHTLTAAQMPSHRHASGNDGGHFVYGGLTNASGPASGAGFRTALTAVNTGYTGGGGAHNNIQPSVTVNWIIRAS